MNADVKKRKGMFICFTGIDGSGKTTLAKSLVDAMEQKGVKAKYVYNRYIPIILRPLMLVGRWLFLRGKDVFENYEDYTDAKKSASKKHPFWATLYQRILLFDYFFQILFKIKLPLFFGKNIVCDRYIYDTIVTDLSVDFNYSKEEIKNLLDKLLSFFPTPHITFLVDLPEEIAFQRKDDLPSVDYLRDRREKYLYLGKECEMIILDGSMPLEEVEHIIEKNVEEVIV